MTRNLKMGPPPDGGRPVRPGRTALHMPKVPRPSLAGPAGATAAERSERAYAAMAALHGAVGDISRTLTAMAPRLMSEETVILDSAGTAAKSYRVPFRSVAVTSLSNSQLTVVPAPLGQGPPQGPGVAVIPPRGFRVCNMSGYAWSITGGSAGDVVIVETFSLPQPPQAAAGMLVGSLGAGAGAVLAQPTTSQGLSATAAANTAVTLTIPAVAGQTIRLTSLSASYAAAATSLSAFGTATNPAASAVIASLALPAGTWTLQLILELAGTLTATDEDNMQLVQGAAVLGQQTVNIETASSAPNPPRSFQVTIAGGGQTVAIQAVANASGASAVYRAQIIATPGPVAGNVTVVCNAVTVHQLDVASAAPLLDPLPDGGILLGPAGQAAVITLAAGGANVTGKLNAAWQYGS